MSDDALDEPGNDPRSKYFDRTAFVESMTGAIESARAQSKSSVFGLIGAWGSGKSTIISSLSTTLENADWQVHHFNPWLYSDAESLRWGFFDELRTVVPVGDKWQDTRSNLTKLSNAVVPAAKLVGAFGAPDLSGFAKDLLNPERASASRMREKVSKQLEELVDPVLIILDDLDRLTSTELLEVFKLVRFIGRLPNVYYLLCYDEKTLIDLLAKTDLVGDGNDRRALDYLEKIVQLRFDIPPLRTDLVETLFEVALRGITESKGVSLSVDDEGRLVQLMRSGLIERLTTPRAIRNLFAQLEAFLASVAHEVDTVDFVALSWIRTFEPGLYNLLQSERRFLQSGDIGYEYDEKKATEIRQAQLQSILNRGAVTSANSTSVLNVLQSVFPVIGRVRNADSPRNLPRVAGRRLADDFYFDRYFNFGVPADDLRDSTVRAALSTLGTAGTATADLVQLEKHLLSDTSRTIRKIDTERGHDATAATRVARWSLDKFKALPEQNGWAAPRDQLTALLARTLVDVPHSEIDFLVADTFNGDIEQVYMIVDATRLLMGNQFGSSTEIQAWNERGDLIKSLILPMLPGLMSDLSCAPVFELDGYLWPLMNLWSTLDGSGPRALIRARRDSGVWSTLDVLARLVGSVVPSGSGPEAVSTINDFDPHWAGNFIDVAEARIELATEIDEADRTINLHRTEANAGNRRTYVLIWLNANPSA